MTAVTPTQRMLDYTPAQAPDPVLENEVSSTLIGGNRVISDRVMGDPVVAAVRNLNAHLRAAHDERMVLRKVCWTLKARIAERKNYIEALNRQARDYERLVKSQQALIEILDEKALERARVAKRMPRFLWNWLARNPR